MELTGPPRDVTKFKRGFRGAEYTFDRALEIAMFLPDDRAILCR
jgi:hypothetical protein